jgi:flagellar motor component MotA
MIGGSALGAFIAGNNGKTIKATIKELPLLLRSSKHNRQLYMDLLALLYELLAKARKEGMMKLESDVEDPTRARSSRAIRTSWRTKASPSSCATTCAWSSAATPTRTRSRR